MKKFLTTLVIVILIGIISFTTYLVLSYTILLRTPILIKQDPMVTYFLGKAYYRESSEHKWKNVSIRLHLKEGYEVKTGSRSVLDIKMHEKTAIRLSSRTKVTIDRVNIRELSFIVFSGSIFGKFEKLYKNHKIEIKTPTTIAAIRGTELAVTTKKVTQNKDDQQDSELSDQKYTTTVSSLSGIISVYNPSFWNETLFLPTQHKVVIGSDSPPLNPDRMNDREIHFLQEMMNSIHEEPVFLITEKIYFKKGSAVILKESHKELNEIASKINESKNTLRINGHTDSDGAAYTNHQLSISRAKTIRQYLVAKGVPEKLLTVSGYGESKPIASNKTEKGKAKNRRVEFIIID